jgi:hypothetical protein
MTGKPTTPGTGAVQSVRLTHRRSRAIDSYRAAAADIGPIERGDHLFILMRGQYALIDVILHIIEQVGPSDISVWNWGHARYDIEVLQRLRRERRITGARIILGRASLIPQVGALKGWIEQYGMDSIRFVDNHAKIATIRSESGFKIVVRGSANLNANRRYEQLDISEGDEPFHTIRAAEERLENIAKHLTDGKGALKKDMEDFKKMDENKNILDDYKAPELKDTLGLRPFKAAKTWSKK